MSLIYVLESQLKSEEGLRLQPYLDKFGYTTIGWGHNCGKIPIESVKSVTIEEANALFESDINEAIDEARRLVSNFDLLSVNRRAVLSNMAFNMGQYGLSKFTIFIGYVQAGRFKNAADDLRNNTLVYKELPERYEYLAQLMENG